MILAATALPAPGSAQWFGSVEGQIRAFPESALFESQGRIAPSLAVRPQYVRDWDGGAQLFTFEGFARLDGPDGKRSHLDLRELSWERFWDTWELRVGIRTVFWGVTESQHLVDVINQTDLVEDPDGEQKLGQLMVSAALIRDWGTVDLFVMSGFRERTYPGLDGRLRPGLPIHDDDATYESPAERWHVDLAARYSNYFGPVDIGLSHFRGTSRDPTLVPRFDESGAAVGLIPHYGLIDQTGLDVQATLGGWLWKLEAMGRWGQSEGRMLALTGGFEYTLVGVAGTVWDLGLLVEYLFDDRGLSGPNPFQDDVFLGARLAFNDVQSTDVLAGAIVDRRSGATLVRLEGGRRIGADWTFDVRAVSFLGLSDSDPLFGLRRDGYFELSLARHF